MSELRILLVRGGAPNGVAYHRLLKPHKVMQRYYECVVDDCDAIEQVSDESLSNYNIVITNRTIAQVNSVDAQVHEINRVKKAGVKFVLDIDDYWYLHAGHELTKWWAENNMSQLISANIAHADEVMVTHDVLGRLAERSYVVMPNGVDTTDLQFKVNPRKIRSTIDFGWCGSSNHLKDVGLMATSLKRLNEERVKYRMNYLGWSDKMKNYKQYEYQLTGHNTASNDVYTNIGGKAVDAYATLYDHIDVALIPLCDNTFNSCKSNLKMLEAGFKKKAVIVSNVHPYNSLINHCVNCLKVNAADNDKGWYKSIKRLIANPELITTLAEQLHKDVQPYELSNLCHSRYEFYKSII